MPSFRRNHSVRLRYSRFCVPSLRRNPAVRRTEVFTIYRVILAQGQRWFGEFPAPKLTFINSAIHDFARYRRAGVLQNSCMLHQLAERVFIYSRICVSSFRRGQCYIGRPMQGQLVHVVVFRAPRLYALGNEFLARWVGENGFRRFFRRGNEYEVKIF